MTVHSSLFVKYKNRIFIETGSYLGNGIQAALKTGFESIISIELDDKLFEGCKQRFKNNPNVTLIKGDSYKVLRDVLKSIDEPVTFWLDGHNSGTGTAWGDYHTPLIQELDVIKDHHIKTHTILIDDMRCWKNFVPVHGFTQDDIFAKLKEINPSYRHIYEDTPAGKNDVLVALI